MQTHSISSGMRRSFAAAVFAVAVFVFGTTATALAADATTVKPGGPTPHPVLNGSAQLTGAYDPTQKIHLVFGLKPPHMAEEEKFLNELGKKDSKNYHKFLSAAEWNKRFSPSEKDEQAVVDWAAAQGLTVVRRFPNRLVVDVEGPVAMIESALNLKINAYQLDSKTFFSNDRDPVIPASLASIIQSVGGLNNLQVLHPATKGMKEPDFTNSVLGAAFAPGAIGSKNGNGHKPASLQPNASHKPGSGKPPITGGAYDPTDIYSSEAYDLSALYAQGHCCNPLGNAGVTPPESSIAIATAGTQSGSDFAGFQAQYPYLAYHYQQFYIDGTPSCCDGEGTLDFDWSTAWSNSFGSYVDTSMIYLYDGVNNQFSTFTDVYNAILNDGHARVFSTSWGCEEIYCTPTSVMDTDHAIFNSMVGQGWTLVAATGDQGATAGCGNGVAVQYPASDPNVVGAGGNTLSLDSSSNYISEVGWSGGPYGCGSNDGGSTGGFSSYYSAPSYQSFLGFGARAVPDIALNADWYNTPQNYYFGGGLSGNGGTSIVAPEVAGFFAQENAYMDYVATVNGGCYGTSVCAPIGNGNWYLYYFGQNPSYAAHYPFYDITSGCNNNDITAFYGLSYYCAVTGYDEVTGWGSFNALQLAWAINTYRAGDFAAPTASFYGAAANTWYNTDQYVAWTLTDTTGFGGNPVGVAGFSQGWDFDPGDVSREATPGYGNSFYSGPQYARGTSGCLSLAGGFGCAGGVSQGCHYANVRSWDNSGSSQDQAYGPVCYDTVAPVASAILAGTLVGGVYESAVNVKLACADASSGCSATYYQLDGGGLQTYLGPFNVNNTGFHTLLFHSVDVAGNVESNKSRSFHMESPTHNTLSSSVNPSSYHQNVTFTSKVTATFGGIPGGTVTFKNGTVTLGTGTLNGSGIATFSTTGLTVGTHSITAVYAGNTGFLASTSGAVSQKVNKATTKTAVTSSKNPSTHGTAVTFTATITPAFGGAATGTVTFKNGTATMGTGVVNASNKATFTTSGLTVGTHNITAVYPGNGNLITSTSPVLKQVVK